MGLLDRQFWAHLWATAWAVGRAPAWAGPISLRWAVSARCALGRRAPVRLGRSGPRVRAALAPQLCPAWAAFALDRTELVAGPVDGHWPLISQTIS